MIRIVAQVLLNGVGLLLAAKLVSGIHYEGGLAQLFLAGLLIGLINLLVRPVVVLLSLPLIVVTLGIFFLVINGLMLLLAAALVPGLEVHGCLPAILGGLVLGLFNWLVRGLLEES